jgi:pimeloyl-ACP methyl ester carboxylesterase
MAVIAVLMHISVFAGDVLRSFPELVYHAVSVPPWLNYDIIPPWLQTAVVAVIPAYLFLLRVFHSISAPIIHIARELVDHQYRPRSTELHAIEKRLGHGRSYQPEYPRRALIEARLDTIMEKLVTREPIDKLIFLTHSQGTVIAFDYLRSQEQSPALSRIGEIHLVTLGSPLTHLYAYYFDEYQRPVPKSQLRGNIKSWTNFWRIDDPIGNRVDVVADNFIDNRQLGRGGHVDYWREDAVRRHILSLLEGDDATPAAPAPARPAEPYAAWT